MKTGGCSVCPSVPSTAAVCPPSFLCMLFLLRSRVKSDDLYQPELSHKNTFGGTSTVAPLVRLFALSAGVRKCCLVFFGMCDIRGDGCVQLLCQISFHNDFLYSQYLDDIQIYIP